MKESNRVVYVAIAANVLIAVAKFIAAIVTGSSAMLTEGIHSLVDSGNGGLLLLGDVLGRKPPDSRHQYGHGREIYFWSFVVAIMIFAVGAGISIYEGILRILHPRPIESPLWTYIVLGVSFVFEGSSFLLALRHFRTRKSRDVSLFAAIRRSKNPADFMVLLEDSAALIGIVIAMLGVTLELVTKKPVFDGAASIGIGVLLSLVAFVLARETRGLLVGEGMQPESIAAIQQMCEDDEAIERIAKPLSSYVGPDMVIVNIAARFHRQLDTNAIEAASVRIEQRIREKYPMVKGVFIAPKTLEDRRILAR